MASFTERMVNAAALSVHTYEEVERDTTAMGQAMGVVTLSSVAAGIGNIWRGGPGVLAGVVGALLGWIIWAWLTYLIGTRLLPESRTRADWGQLLRTTGFAAAPGIVRVLGIIPLLGWLVLGFANLWMLAAFVVAVKQALDYTRTGRAIGVCLVGWVAHGVIISVFALTCVVRVRAWGVLRSGR